MFKVMLILRILTKDLLLYSKLIIFKALIFDLFLLNYVIIDS